MQRQDDWIRKVTTAPEKGPVALSQQEWWAQRDLDPPNLLDEKKRSLSIEPLVVRIPER